MQAAALQANIEKSSTLRPALCKPLGKMQSQTYPAELVNTALNCTKGQSLGEVDGDNLWVLNAFVH